MSYMPALDNWYKAFSKVFYYRFIYAVGDLTISLICVVSRLLFFYQLKPLAISDMGLVYE